MNSNQDPKTTGDVTPDMTEELSDGKGDDEDE